MIRGLEHLAVAVTDLDLAIQLWANTTGARVVHRERVAEQGVEVAMLQVGSLKVELLAAMSPESPVGRFIATRGPGIHHLALEVDSAQAELDRMASVGVKTIDRTARTGAEGTRVGFIHPRTLGGVLIEVVERTSYAEPGHRPTGS